MGLRPMSEPTRPRPSLLQGPEAPFVGLALDKAGPSALDLSRPLGFAQGLGLGRRPRDGLRPSRGFAPRQLRWLTPCGLGPFRGYAPAQPLGLGYAQSMSFPRGGAPRLGQAPRGCASGPPRGLRPLAGFAGSPPRRCAPLVGQAGLRPALRGPSAPGLSLAELGAAKRSFAVSL